MKDTKLEKGIEEIRRISMTSLEKDLVFQNVIEHRISSTMPIRSPWSIYVFGLRHRTMALASLSLIILLASGGGVAFASGNSLPDSILYPIKVNIVEPIRGSLIFSAVAKAKYESSLATERMVEAETLAGQGKLDVETEKKLNALLEDHTLALNDALNKVDKTDSSDKSDEITTNFYAEMNAHARVLDIINNKEQSIKDENTVDPTDSNNEISHTARDNARSAKDKLIKNQINKNKDKVDGEDYKKRREAVQSLIDQTSTLLDKENPQNSQVKKRVIENTNKTLNKAKQFLDDAKKKEDGDNRADKYSSLIDSESSAKEASLFLRVGSKFEDKENKEKE